MGVGMSVWATWETSAPGESPREGWAATEVAPSVLEAIGQRLIEHEVRDGVDISCIELRSLIQQEVSLRRPACR